MTKTVFERIILGELPCKKVLENEFIIAFEDINPQAPIHILIATKKPIPNLQSVSEADLFLMGHIVRAAQAIAHRLKISDNYRLVTNNGPKAGQSVFHLHFHLLGGKPFDDDMVL